ncbi:MULTISPECIES: type II toxin-antitoxin system RelE family toxin [Helcococcus]|uniref:Type II toxin-antitoxin system RelE/ParE family toxin n=1 Tax=Helcococcus bovis TaxID=3153252 RepID=A0ABW9F9G3_9FIRM
MGKNLVGNFKGSWRYRVGKYRIIVEINDDIIILILNIGHCKEIYKR